MQMTYRHIFTADQQKYWFGYHGIESCSGQVGGMDVITTLIMFNFAKTKFMWLCNRKQFAKLNLDGLAVKFQA